LLFCFSIEKIKQAEKTKNQRAAPTARKQKAVPEKLAPSYVNIRWHYATPRGAAV